MYSETPAANPNLYCISPRRSEWSMAVTNDDANWPRTDALSDEPQVLDAWQDPDDGTILAIEKDTGTTQEHMHGFHYFVVLRNAPFWEDDHVLDRIAKSKTQSEAEIAAGNYMADHRL